MGALPDESIKTYYYVWVYHVWMVGGVDVELMLQYLRFSVPLALVFLQVQPKFVSAFFGHLWLELKRPRNASNRSVVRCDRFYNGVSNCVSIFDEMKPILL